MYTRFFWGCYILLIVWAAMVLLSFYLFDSSNVKLYSIDSVERFFALKLRLRRLTIIIVCLALFHYFLFWKRKYFSVFSMFTTSWMRAALIDDSLIMKGNIYVPEHWLPTLTSKIRPIAVFAISWIAFEAHIRKDQHYE